jgi:rhodanese-related sulfurtransferase
MAKAQSRKKTQAQSGRSPLVYLIGVVVVLVVAFAAWQLLTPSAPAETAPEGGLPLEVSVAQAATMRDEGAFVLDVREPSEWEAGHIPDATLIPLGQLSSRVSEVPTDQPVVIICRSGNRSAQARDLLRNAGYTNVTSVAGGMNNWQSQGLPTVTGP